MPANKFENKVNKDFRNNKTKKEVIKENEISTKHKTLAYDINYINIDDCLKRFDKLFNECEKAKTSIKKPDNTISGKGNVTTSLNQVIKEYEEIWKHVSALIKSTKGTVSTFKQISKNADK